MAPKTLFYTIDCTVCKVKFKYRYKMDKLLEIVLVASFVLMFSSSSRLYI
jgi:hypothetical protein